MLQVVKFHIKRPSRERGDVVDGGQVLARFEWLNGPPTFMSKYASKEPLQDYTSKEFKEQYRIVKRQPLAQWQRI